MKKTIISLSAALMLIASCGTTKTSEPQPALEGEWNILQVGDTQIDASNCEQPPFLGFNAKDKQLYGSTGCNLLTGSLNADAAKGTIDFSGAGSTRMLCADMQTERLVLDALSHSTGYRIEGTRMTLTDKSGKATAILQKKN